MAPGRKKFSSQSLKKYSKTLKKKNGSWKLNWDDRFIKSLIGYYQDHPYLWNTKLPNYKNKAKKQLCLAQWLKIENVYLSLEKETELVEEVGRKFHSLRTRFGTEKNKVVKKITGSEADSQEFYPSWKYYRSLQFLKEVIEPRPIKSNLAGQLKNQIEGADNNPEAASCQSSAVINTQPVIAEGSQDELDQSHPFCISFDGANYTPFYSQSMFDIEETDKPVISTIQQDQNLASVQRKKAVGKVPGSLYLQVRKCQVLQKKDDREDLFFSYCAETMRLLPIPIREKARIEIQEILNKYILQSAN